MTSAKLNTNLGSGANRYYAAENILRSNEDSVIVGHFDKQTQRPAPGYVEAKMKPGLYSIPNYSLVWARRVLDKANKATGELIFDQPWGEGGSAYEAVGIRYLKSMSSLDLQWQNEKGAKVSDDDMFLELSADITYIDGKVDPMRKLFFQVCSLNKDSICRNPEAGIMFGEYDAGKFVRIEMDKFDIDVKAMNIISDARVDEDRAIVLGNMFGLDTKKPHEEIVGDLLLKMKSNPLVFLQSIDEIVNNMRKNIVFAKDNGIVGLEHPNVIQIKNVNHDGYDILFSDVPVNSAEEKIEWMLSDVLTSSTTYDNILKIVETVAAFQKLN